MSGRGAYYKNLYGRKGSGSSLSRGVKRSYNEVDSGETGNDYRSGGAHGNIQDLTRLLKQLEGKGYQAYREILGTWTLVSGSKLRVEKVQPDPYAPASRFRLYVPHHHARFPNSLYNSSIRKIALCDYLARRLYSESTQNINVDRPGQQVLERSSMTLDDSGLEVRFTVDLPAEGRRIKGYEAANLFSTGMPRMENSILYAAQDAMMLQDFVDCVEDQEDLRRQVMETGLQAFIPDGAILPRASGIYDTPLSGPTVVPFKMPLDLRCSYTLPHRGTIHGMGIPKRVTMICGGGFHGKSTLLSAIAEGCYNHIPGDGREFVVTSKNVISVEGEDGRSIKNVNISPFIADLPGGIPTTSFSTADASGSTSMAAGVIEALELGADTLLFDEDTCATNFLIKDRRMQRLVANDPISPLIHNIKALFRTHRCSSILVIGGCGDYCDVADYVLEMRNFECFNITERARKVAQEIPSDVLANEKSAFPSIVPRLIDRRSLPRPSDKVAARRGATIDVGQDKDPLYLSKLRQLVGESQTRGVAAALRWLGQDSLPGGTARAEGRITDILDRLEEALDDRGLDILMFGKLDPFIIRPRPIEVGMALNRLRSAYIR